MAKKRCIICGKWYMPNPRTAKTQKTCSDPACRRERKLRADKAWLAKNPGWTAGRRIKARQWSQAYPDYWRNYRAEHPEYRERECLRKKRYRVLCAAKQDAIGQRLDGVLDYLTVRACAAKQDDIAPLQAG